ncbi:hypothetical protein CP8484711_0150B, partial [Chlamydia psittaci 84-8471/1]
KYCEIPNAREDLPCE